LKPDVKPSVALVGAGWVVQKCYLPALATLDLPVAAVADIDLAAAERLVARLGAGAVCGDLDELLGLGVDLVVIATPNCTHAALSRQALATGCSVLCEKPLALNKAEVTDLLDHGASRLHVSSPFRFRTDVQALLDVAKSGTLGHVYRTRVSWVRARGIPRPGSWYTNRRQSGGGVLTDLGPHMLDLALLLLGEKDVTEVSAWTGETLSASYAHASPWMPAPAGGGGEQVIDVEDQASVQVTFDDRSLLEVHLSWAGFRGHDRTCFELEGTRGRAVLETLLGYSTMAPPTPPRLRLWAAGGAESREFELRRDPGLDFGHMLRALVNPSAGGLATTSGRDSLRIVDIIERAYLSARSRRRSPQASELVAG
jgi:predicted dehydrogenase